MSACVSSPTSSLTTRTRTGLLRRFSWCLTASRTLSARTSRSSRRKSRRRVRSTLSILCASQARTRRRASRCLRPRFMSLSRLPSLTIRARCRSPTWPSSTRHSSCSRWTSCSFTMLLSISAASHASLASHVARRCLSALAAQVSSRSRGLRATSPTRHASRSLSPRSTTPTTCSRISSHFTGVLASLTSQRASCSPTRRLRTRRSSSFSTFSSTQASCPISLRVTSSRQSSARWGRSTWRFTRMPSRRPTFSGPFSLTACGRISTSRSASRPSVSSFVIARRRSPALSTAAPSTGSCRGPKRRSPMSRPLTLATLRSSRVTRMCDKR
mmetsp:Transcript_61268/g.162139  ORF Transcript_61268/g.162139 Transcript_61268/m.162139 type:complete len:328 (-) Transcript_61268:4601-5584(-)